MGIVVLQGFPGLDLALEELLLLDLSLQLHLLCHFFIIWLYHCLGSSSAGVLVRVGQTLLGPRSLSEAMHLVALHHSRRLKPLRVVVTASSLHVDEVRLLGHKAKTPELVEVCWLTKLYQRRLLVADRHVS